MEKENNYINVYAGITKKRWLEYCEKTGKKPGAAIREAMEMQLAAFEEPRKLNEKAVYMQLNEPDEVGSSRISLRMKPSEKQKLLEISAGQGCSPQWILISLLRAYLIRTPQFCTHEIEALWQSNYQLRAIGRNLNSIVAAINKNNQLVGKVKEEQLEFLTKRINDHTVEVSQLVSANLERWKIE